MNYLLLAGEIPASLSLTEICFLFIQTDSKSAVLNTIFNPSINEMKHLVKTVYISSLALSSPCLSSAPGLLLVYALV